MAKAKGQKEVVVGASLAAITKKTGRILREVHNGLTEVTHA
jgi:hypothetical protein